MSIDIKLMAEVLYWQKKLKIRNFLLGVDNKTKFIAYVCDCKIGQPLLFLNLKSMRDESVGENISTIFHEFGHIKHRTYLNKVTIENKIKGEIIAESYALKQLKEYFPKEYKTHIKKWKKLLEDKSWEKKFPIHFNAFSQIKEFKEE